MRPARPSAQARRAHDQARERYEGWTKAELSDELADRNLPKTGNIDELIERLVADDQARERYKGLTKAELSDQLADRDLPKTGNVDELIERLVEADSKVEAARIGGMVTVVVLACRASVRQSLTGAKAPKPSASFTVKGGIELSPLARFRPRRRARSGRETLP